MRIMHGGGGVRHLPSHKLFVEQTTLAPLCPMQFEVLP